LTMKLKKKKIEKGKGKEEQKKIAKSWHSNV
jgi:hypothetical protein